MKRVAEDQSYIDYTQGNFGVRVEKDRAQSIASEGGEWLVFPNPIETTSIPADRNKFPMTCGPWESGRPIVSTQIDAFASTLPSPYGDELKSVLFGDTSFEQALRGY
jgi:hypothetical protein